MTNTPYFDDWMHEVDRILVALLGVESIDLADQCYSDWFDDGLTPHQAASLVLQSEGF